MKVSGQLDLNTSPMKAMSALNDPRILQNFLLSTSSLTQTGPSDYAFSIRHRIGPIVLNLPGTLSVRQTEPGRASRFEASAAHDLGGTARLLLDMTFLPREAQCALSWDGTLEATGLAGRLLAERQDRVNTVVDNLMRAFAAQVATRGPTRAV